MKHINTIATPAVVVFTTRLQDNINRFAHMAKTAAVQLRPHIKTHRHPRIMEMQKLAGAQGFTVSTLGEARHCIRYGHHDLCYAVPIEAGKFDQARDIVNSGVTLHLLTDSLMVAQQLEEHAATNGWRPSMYMKIDCGNHRVGVDPESPEALALARYLHEADHLDFAGILAHSGHAYNAMDDHQRRDIAISERDITAGFAQRLRNAGIEVPCASIGSTPAFSTGISLDGIDEARPGNYVFFDYTQQLLGSCTENQVSLFVCAAVISTQAGRTVVDAGATILSKDPGPFHLDPACGFGQVYTTDMQHIGMVESLSQEHGLLKLKDAVSLAPGERLLIMPNHSCLVACTVPGYWAAEDNGVCEWWDKD